MNFEDIKVKVAKPYPEIEGAQNDKTTVAVLKNLATSKESELSAILQYVYQSVIAGDIMPEVADIIEEIAVVEMTHMDMLMHAIVDFGGNPKYEDGMGYPFSPSKVNYSTKLIDMLNANIMGEEKAIEDYTKAITMVKNKSLMDLFARIIEDEKAHIEIFKKLKNNIEFFSL